MKRKKYIYKIVYDYIGFYFNFVCEAKNDVRAIKMLYKKHLADKIISIERIGEDGFLYRAE